MGADLDLNSPEQMQVLGKHGGLDDLALGIVQPGAPEPGWRVEAQGCLPVFQTAEVEAVIDQNVEGEPVAGAELEHTHAAFRPVAQCRQADAEDLRCLAELAHQLLPREVTAVQCRHVFFPFVSAFTATFQVAGISPALFIDAVRRLQRVQPSAPFDLAPEITSKL